MVVWWRQLPVHDTAEFPAPPLVFAALRVSPLCGCPHRVHDGPADQHPNGSSLVTINTTSYPAHPPDSKETLPFLIIISFLHVNYTYIL